MIVGGSVATLVAGVAAFLWLDRPLALFMKAHVGGGLERTFEIITKFGQAHYVLIPAAIWACLVWRKPDRRPQVFVPVFLFAATALSGLTELALKFIFARYRPIRLFDQDQFGFAWFQHGWAVNSFPSGHAQTIFAAMGACMVIWPRWWGLWGGCALLVGASRVVLTAHYVSDVIAGAWVGGIWVVMLARLFRHKGWAFSIPATRPD